MACQVGHELTLSPLPAAGARPSSRSSLAPPGTRLRPRSPAPAPRPDPCTALVRDSAFQAVRLVVLMASVGTWSTFAVAAVGL